MSGTLCYFMYSACLLKCKRHKNSRKYDLQAQSPGLLCHVNAEDGGTMLLQNAGNYLPADAT